MRIGINGRFLLVKQTGVQRAAYNLVSTLIKLDRKNEYLIFTGYSELKNPDWAFENVTVIPSLIRGGSAFRNLIWEQVQLPLLAKRYKVDVLHSPANMAPLFYAGKSILHIHDVCFIVNPQWYSFAFRTWYKFVIPKLARKATRVVTNSNSSKNDLLRYCDLDNKKLKLVYWAVDDSFKNDKPNPESKQDYILYVGSLEPRKNIKNLIRAFCLMKINNPEIKTKLVLIGGESPLFARLKLTINQFQDDIILKGFVTENELRTYYQRAMLVAYPSLYEGFGLPPLEAMASGSAVVTSTTSSLPEIVGNAAIKVNPREVESLAEAFKKIITDQIAREELVRMGFDRVKRFSWAKVARSVLSIYYETYFEVNMPFEEWERTLMLEQNPRLSRTERLKHVAK